MIHHPPLSGQTPPRRALKDTVRLEREFGKFGAELILHGHNHTNSLAWANGPDGRIPVLGIAAGGMSRLAHGASNLGRYNLITFQPQDGGWRMEVIGRGFAAPGGPVIELDHRSFSLDGELTEPVAAG